MATNEDTAWKRITWIVGVVLTTVTFVIVYLAFAIGSQVENNTAAIGINTKLLEKFDSRITVNLSEVAHSRELFKAQQDAIQLQLETINRQVGIMGEDIKSLMRN